MEYYGIYPYEITYTNMEYTLYEITLYSSYWLDATYNIIILIYIQTMLVI